MKKLLFALSLLALVPKLWAACGTSRFPENPKLDGEIQDICQELQMIPLSSMDVTGSSGAYLTAQGVGNKPKWSDSSIFSYRKPDLVFISTNVMTVSTGVVTGISGDATLAFDSNLVLTTTITAYQLCYASMTYSLSGWGSGNAGIMTGTATLNTWYVFYGVRTTDDINWVLVASTVPPTVAMSSTLNSHFGAGRWRVIGTGRFGNGGDISAGWINIKQSGAVSIAANILNPVRVAQPLPGIEMANGSTAANVTYTYSAGMSAAQVPPNLKLLYWSTTNSGNTNVRIRLMNSTATSEYNNIITPSSVPTGFIIPAGQPIPATDGFRTQLNTGVVTADLVITGWIDSSI